MYPSNADIPIGTFVGAFTARGWRVARILERRSNPSRYFVCIYMNINTQGEIHNEEPLSQQLIDTRSFPKE